MDSRATQLKLVCPRMWHYIRMLLALSQSVNCIFWPIKALNCLVAASKLHKHRMTCCTAAAWPYCRYTVVQLQQSKISRIKSYAYLSDYVFTLNDHFFVCIKCTLMRMILGKCN